MAVEAELTWLLHRGPIEGEQTLYLVAEKCFAICWYTSCTFFSSYVSRSSWFSEAISNSMRRCINKLQTDSVGCPTLSLIYWCRPVFGGWKRKKAPLDCICRSGMVGPRRDTIPYGIFCCFGRFSWTTSTTPYERCKIKVGTFHAHRRISESAMIDLLRGVSVLRLLCTPYFV